MSGATKPVDRRRPFRRIDNDVFKPKKDLDGDGVACGCRVQRDLGDLDARLEKFLQDTEEKALGKALKAFLDAVFTALHPAALAKALNDLIKKELGNAAALLLGKPIEVLGFLGEALLAPVNAIVDPIKKALEVAAKTFMRIFATPIFMRAIRTIPQWVSVNRGASNNSVDRSQVVEVEGICVRSYGNPVDVPLANWHTWFSWSVQVELENEYRQALSPASNPPNRGGAQGTEVPVTPAGAFEIQWDAGALFESDTPYRKGFEEAQMPDHDGPMVVAGERGDSGATDFQTDFFWPMPGMFVWASGRHVYDCSRVTHRADNTTGRDAEATPPLMCAMLQPARALATARFGAVVFPDNGKFAVPAVEFMFVACKRGGYIKHDAMADEDYVFIIDLPPGPAAASPFPIANTDEVPHNTITLRPRLLHKLRFIDSIGSSSGQPVIEPMPPAEPGRAPRQVRLRIPSGVLGGDAYGFKLSLGWHDPTREFARKVLVGELEVRSMLMRLTDREAPAAKLRNLLGDREAASRRALLRELEELEIDLPLGLGKRKLKNIPFLMDIVRPAVEGLFTKLLDAIVDLMPTETEEEWLIRIGVNGIYVALFRKPTTPLKKDGRNQPVPLLGNALTFRFLLAEGDELRFAMHGSEFDPVGDIMHEPMDKRTIKERDSGAPVPWANIVDPPRRAQFDEILNDYVHLLMFSTAEGVTKISLGFDNSPIGLIDPAGAGGNTPQDNPMRPTGPVDAAVRRRASFARVVPPEMVFLHDEGAGARPDYEVTYTLKLRRQLPDEAADA